MGKNTKQEKNKMMSYIQTSIAFLFTINKNLKSKSWKVPLTMTSKP